MKIKGFATIEVMLAIILVAGIVVLLMQANSASSHRTNTTNIARGYAVMTNNIITIFYNQVADCINASSDSDCELDTYSSTNAYNYLSDEMTSSVKSTLQARDIDPTDVTVQVCWTRLDEGC